MNTEQRTADAEPMDNSAEQSDSRTAHDPGDLYDAFYYQNCCGQPYERNETQLRFFAAMADRIARAIAPKKMLDVGCALGMLVESLRDCGIKADGIDISPYAISQVREDIKPFCRVGSIMEPFPENHYDFIICMEVVEHLPEEDAARAVENLCRHSDDILLTSSPLDFREATHYNVQPPEYWAALFALNGFYRDLSVDVTFIMPWAMRFRRITEPIHRLVSSYERELWHRQQQVRGLQETAHISREQAAAIAEAQRALAGKQQDVEALHASLEESQHVIKSLEAKSERFENELRLIYSSRIWRWLVEPLRRLQGAGKSTG